MVRRLCVFAAGLGVLLAFVGCSQPGEEAVARGLGPAVPARAELAGLLLRVEDLPGGYESQPTVPAAPPSSGGQGGGSGSAPGAEPCADVFEQLRGGEPALNSIASGTAQAEFGKGDSGPFLQEELLSSGDRAALQAGVDAFRKLPELCAHFTETGEEGSFTMALSAADLPALGDESVGVKLDATGKSEDLQVTMSGYLMMVRKGSVLCIIIHFGIPGVDAAETENIARAAVARLG